MTSCTGARPLSSPLRLLCCIVSECHPSSVGFRTLVAAQLKRIGIQRGGENDRNDGRVSRVKVGSRNRVAARISNSYDHSETCGVRYPVKGETRERPQHGVFVLTRRAANSKSTHASVCERSCRVIEFEIYRQHFLSTPEDGPWQCMVAGRAGLGSSGTKIQIRPYFTHTPSHHSSHHITHNMLHNRWLYRGSRGNSSAKVCDLA